MNYGLDIWANNNFTIEGDNVCLNYKSNPTLLDITKQLRLTGLKGPLIFRFPHIIEKQINTLFTSFTNSINELKYNGSFNAVFPLKVNQLPNVVDQVISSSRKYNYGLEAGSKAELVLAIDKTPIGSPITVNGFKDAEMIELGFIAAQIGHNITLTIEGLNELESIINLASKSELKVPNIGIRVRLHSGGSGVWAKSGGIASKFGLTSTEIIIAMDLLQKNNLLDKFTMLHFHIGSQLEDIAPIKKALRESGNIYAELKKLGASSLKAINIGGGLAVEYSQKTKDISRTYNLQEFSNDVVYLLKEIMDRKNVEHPNIFTESGRFIVAAHSVLITPVLELFSHDYQAKFLNLKTSNPPLIEELNDLYNSIDNKRAIEYLHDALDHMESLLTLFDLGYIDLQDRSNAEILVQLIIKKALYISDVKTPEIKRLQALFQEKYLINASFFQSIPDYWGLKQKFPIMPIHNLKKEPLLSATLWDITCDSDGEIEFDPSSPLYLHDINLDIEDYFLAFFQVGAYQETLGMSHNMFEHPTEATIEINDNGFEIKQIIESNSILQTLESFNYNSNEILIKLKNKLAQSNFITETEKSDTLAVLENYLYQNGYLRTTQI